MNKILLLLFGACLFVSSYSQEYFKVKVSLKNGLTIDGKPGMITPDSVSFMSDGKYYAYPLSEVQSISVKKGKGQKVAFYAAGGCAGISLGVLALSGGETTNYYTGESEKVDLGQYLLGTALWMVIFGGVGCLIGTLADDWNMVYMNTHSSILKRTNLNFAADPKGRVMLKLKYTF
jgi:hypothetical protein